MNKQEQQYFKYLKNLGYDPTYNEGKSSFLIKNFSRKIYLKCCEYPASQETIDLAKKHSSDIDIILLEGNLTFREYDIYSEGEKYDMGVLTTSGSKYAPYFFGEYDPDYFEDETIAIAMAISEKDLVCRRCGKTNQYRISKNIHYKATCVCGTFITNVSTNKPLVIHFGKYQGRELESMVHIDEVKYLQWAINSKVFSKKLEEAAIKFLGL